MAPVRAPSVERVLTSTTDNGSGALIGYIPVGFPTLDGSVEAAEALADNGFDVIELGVPYSDPTMDGTVIQAATQKSLRDGFRLRHVFEAIEKIRSRVSIPVLVMTYWNPVVQFGIEEFAQSLVNAGGSGLITPDLIYDEAQDWIDISDRYDLDRIFLAAPSSTDERLKAIVGASRGFVYTVSRMGTTGAQTSMDSGAQSLVKRLRAVGCERACVGLGISSPEHVGEVLSYADGAIIGSALIRALASDGVGGLATLAHRLNSGRSRTR